jgi:hypothetical protein
LPLILLYGTGSLVVMKEDIFGLLLLRGGIDVINVMLSDFVQKFLIFVVND